MEVLCCASSQEGGLQIVCGQHKRTLTRRCTSSVAAESYMRAGWAEEARSELKGSSPSDKPNTAATPSRFSDLRIR